jgi:hypothetical protein
MKLRIAWVLIGLGLICGLISAQDGIVVDIGVPLNVREEPNTDARVLVSIPPRSSVEIVGRSPGNTWYQVQLENGTRGWVAAEYISVTNIIAPYVYDAEVEVPFEVESLISGISENSSAIFAYGQRLGNNPNVFSKIGDSITVSLFNLQSIGYGEYTLSDYWYLRPVIEYYSVATIRDGNSFTYTSMAATTGWNASTLLNPNYANANCNLGETPLDCEYRLTRPAIAFIMVGTNDVGFITAGNYRENLETIVNKTVSYGIIPILSTIPQRLDDSTVNERVPTFNGIIADVAQTYQVPLIDLYTAMLRLPNGGLDLDGVHPSLPPGGYDSTANFTENNLTSGYVVRNLLQLHAIDAVWRLVILKQE